jgi:hypothetical protein
MIDLYNGQPITTKADIWVRREIFCLFCTKLFLNVAKFTKFIRSVSQSLNYSSSRTFIKF